MQICDYEGKILGNTHSHEVPRKGEALVWRGQQYRVIDVAHPTEDVRGKGIYQPLVQVVVDDIRWLDGDEKEYLYH